MKSSYEKICRMLALSGYNDKDLENFIYEVHHRSPNRVIRDIEDVRRSMNSFISMSESSEFAKKNLDIDYERKSYLLGSEGDTIMKIERLLLQEAGLSKSTAIHLLSNELMMKFPNAPIPHESKKGFYSWVERLINFIPEKDLLYIATNIRNKIVHDAPIDWRLK